MRVSRRVQGLRSAKLFLKRNPARLEDSAQNVLVHGGDEVPGFEGELPGDDPSAAAAEIATRGRGPRARRVRFCRGARAAQLRQKRVAGAVALGGARWDDQG